MKHVSQNEIDKIVREAKIKPATSRELKELEKSGIKPEYVDSFFEKAKKELEPKSVKSYRVLEFFEFLWHLGIIAGAVIAIDGLIAGTDLMWIGIAILIVLLAHDTPDSRSDATDYRKL